ncbi:hypothetical protein B0J12DRAFT_226767 [Macrophomina phaseolina]|uniref:Uncharacterized protein n=1 Tax=Macrophomina phaseolina TaxID=35725 RepID=A0ABQ8GSP1_9PEZI|nr:hypothetical protein B0J12DRAFT_226767 [Macrophomina phaseolina]
MHAVGVAFPHPRAFHHQHHPLATATTPSLRLAIGPSATLATAVRPPPAARDARAQGSTLGPASSPNSCTATSVCMDLACRPSLSSLARLRPPSWWVQATTPPPHLRIRASVAQPPRRSGKVRSGAAHPATRGLAIPQELVGPVVRWRGGKRPRCGRFSLRRTLTMLNQFCHAISPSSRLVLAPTFPLTTRLSCIFARGTGAPSREACAPKPKAFSRYRLARPCAAA